MFSFNQERCGGALILNSLGLLKKLGAATMNQYKRENCGSLLAKFIKENDLDVRRVAKAIGCSEATLNRILTTQSLPSDEMMKQAGIIIELVFVSYSKLSSTQKEHIRTSARPI